MLYDVDNADYPIDVGKLRVPIRYLASLFSAGNEEVIVEALNKLMALRAYMRARNLGENAEDVLENASLNTSSSLNRDDAERLYRLFTLASYDERFAIPPAHREYLEESEADVRRGWRGIGIIKRPRGGV